MVIQKSEENLPHKELPREIVAFIFTNKKAQETFESTTDLARNEWI